MTGPVDLEATTKTREVIRTDALADNRSARWMPWQEKEKQRATPTSPSSDSVQTIFGPGIPPRAVVGRNPDAIGRNSLHFAKEFFRGHFFWWYWGVYVLFQFGGLTAGASLLATILCVTAACLIYGLYRAIEEQRNAHRIGPPSQRMSSFSPVLPRPTPMLVQTPAG